MILFNYYYYVMNWAGRQSYPHTPFMTDPAISLLIYARTMDLNGSSQDRSRAPIAVSPFFCALKKFCDILTGIDENVIE